MWFNRNSPKVGILKTEAYINIPAYFLSDNARTPVYYTGGEKRFKISLTPDKIYSVNDIELEKGYYFAITEPIIDGYLEINDKINSFSRIYKFGDKIFTQATKYDIKIRVKEKCEVSSLIFKYGL